MKIYPAKQSLTISITNYWLAVAKNAKRGCVQDI